MPLVGKRTAFFPAYLFVLLCVLVCSYRDEDQTISERKGKMNPIENFKRIFRGKQEPALVHAKDKDGDNVFIIGVLYENGDAKGYDLAGGEITVLKKKNIVDTLTGKWAEVIFEAIGRCDDDEIF